MIRSWVGQSVGNYFHFHSKLMRDSRLHTRDTSDPRKQSLYILNVIKYKLSCLFFTANVAHTLSCILNEKSNQNGLYIIIVQNQANKIPSRIYRH